MKKQLKNMAASMRKIANALNDEQRTQFEEIAAQLEEMAASTDDEGRAEMAAKLAEIQETLKAVASTEEVAERIQKLRNEITGMLNAGKSVKDKLTPELAKEVANAIRNAKNRDDVRNSVDAILKQNGITGLSYGYIVDYSLELKLEDNEGLYDELHKTPFSRFIYTEIDRTQATQIAKGWDKNSESEKAIQELEANDRTIDCKYVYKRQAFALEDLDEIEDNGQLQEFLATISQELRILVKSGIVQTILVGDNVNTGSDKITTFETIGTKVASDAITTVLASDDADVQAFITRIGASTMQRTVLAAAR
jgi:hypothetical protein